MSFYNQLEKWGNRTAVITEQGEQLTYAELEKICGDIGRAVKKRKIAFFMCENSLGALIWYVAFLHGGIVPLLLNCHMKREQVMELQRIYQPDYLCMPQNMLPIDEKCREVLAQKEYVLYALCGRAERHLPEELALLLSTSGSTGSSKLVRQSYQNISSNADTIAGYLKLTQQDCAVTTLPMNYTYGLSIINSHLAVGATVLVTGRSVMEKEFWDAVKKYQVTNINGVPYTWEIMNKLRFFEMQLPAVRLIVCGGGKLTCAMHKKMAAYADKNGKEFVVRYGQTESTANMSYLPSEMAAVKVGSIGRAIPGGAFELWESDGQVILGANRVGELVYRGDNVTLGYAQNAEELEKGDEFQGLLITGDMASRDEDGYYYIVGRKKRFLKIFGNRVNQDETERLIAAAFPQVECACTGVDDSMLIYVTEDSEREQIRDYAAKMTGIHKSAFTVRKISKIPKNEAGKILYSSLEKE